MPGINAFHNDFIRCYIEMFVRAVFGNQANDAAMGEVKGPGGEIVRAIVRPHSPTEKNNSGQEVGSEMSRGSKDVRAQ